MDSEHHHELERNALADWIERGLEYLRPRWKYIFAAIGGLVALFIGWQLYSANAASSRAAAWNDFFGDNFKEVADKYAGYDAARYAKLRLGDKAFQDGMTALLGSRDEALQSFNKAIQQYDDLIADSSSPADVRRKAMLNKALALECRGAPDTAKDAYKSVAAQYADTNEAMVAEDRIKRLDRKSAVEFYRQFVNYKPTAAELAPPTPPPGSEALPAMPDLLENLKKAAEKNRTKTPPAPPIPAPPVDMKGSPSTGTKEPKKVVPSDVKPPAKDSKADAKDSKPADAKSAAKDAKATPPDANAKGKPPEAPKK